MSIARRIRVIGTTSVVAVVPLATAMAQTQPDPSPASPPAATQPQPSATPAAPQATPTDKKAAASTAIGDLVGLTAKSSDGANLGTVYGVTMAPGGKVTAIGLKVGGFLGFGGHMVIIPDGKFNRVGDTVQINMTSDEVHKLPEAKKQS
jgi:PRC-barrel domain protein